MAKPRDELPWKETARLYALVSPRLRKAVLLRRGPGDHVRMISWNMKTDQFTPGQWLKKRVYERRCDLSPNGRHFIYFAADYAAGFGSWTAVSRPPFFSALTLWPKGDGWGGGGLFSADGRKIYLNHPAAACGMSVAPDFKPAPMQVRPLHEGSGGGEDDPIRYYRMIRDGWMLFSRGSHSKSHGLSAPYGYVQKKPTIYKKIHEAGIGRNLWALQLSSKYTAERQGRWNVEEAHIVDNGGNFVREIGRVDWCDLDHNGDVLWAWAGKLWRLKYNRRPAAYKLRTPVLLGDFNDMMFENIEPSPEALTW